MIVADLCPLAVDIERVHNLEGNPRRGDVDALARSLERFGQRKPIVAQRDGTVLAGNHTLAAAKLLDWTEIAVVWVDDDDRTAKGYALADNRTAELGTYDETELAALIAEVNATDDALLDATGWSPAELDELLGRIARDDSATIASSAALFDDDALIDAAFAHYRDVGFPWPSMPLNEQMAELNALAMTDTQSLIESRIAYHVADPYNPHRYTTPVVGKCTAVEAFNADDKLRHALRLALDAGKITKTSLLGTLHFVRGSQVAAQFRPGFALYLYRRFAPDGGTVLDTSTGFGGRLLGFIASSAQTYVGIDPEQRTCDGNQRIVDALCPASKTVELIELPAEDVPLAHVRDRCDFAFTSPPYFAKERYGESDSQSCVRYTTPDDWRDGFLVPTLRLQYEALRADSVAAMNVADVKIGDRIVPLEKMTVDAALAAGFTHEATERFPLPRVPGQGEQSVRYEPLLIFRKGRNDKRKRT